LALALAAAPTVARAQVQVQVDDVARPRMAASIGAGASFDSAGLSGRTAVPSLFATGDVGADGPLGFELAAFTSSAVGRYDGTPIDRLALDAAGVVRPLAWKLAADDRRYRARFGRTLGAELGLGLERDATTTHAGSRWGLHLGARAEFPLGLPGYASELRLRLAVRRLQGFYTPVVQGVTVGNTFEAYAALVSVF
jgi:hypothetical protein